MIYIYKSFKVSSSLQKNYFESMDELSNLNFSNNLYLPEYQNTFSRNNELNDTNFNFNKIKNNKSVVLIPDKIILENEKLLEIESVSNLINNIENNNINTTTNKKITKSKKEIYSDDYSFYGSVNILTSDYNYKYIKKNALIYDKGSSSIKDIITTEPEEIKLQYDICMPHSKLFKIYNKSPDENLIIRDIKTDLYQVRIFPYISNKNSNSPNFNGLTPNINSYLEHSIYPRSIFVFQLLFLLDFKTTLKGTLYIEFNDKKVLLIPIQILGVRNSYNIEPIYRINFQNKKLFEEYIKISNPTSKNMHIEQIVHNLQKIKVFWENGEIVSNNSNTNISIINIAPITNNKNVLILRYYPKNLGNEYGFIHLKIDENSLVIPVLLNVVNSPILTEPKLINFGLCDITQKSRNNFIRIIPLKLVNNGKEYIKIGNVYIHYDEVFLQFHQNFGGNNIIIKPNEKVLFGYFIFNANVPTGNNKKLKDLINKSKKIFIETNSTSMHFVELYYTYIPYINNELQEVVGNFQQKPKNSEMFSFFINVKLKKGIKLRTYNSYLPGENITISDRYLVAKVKNPSNEYQSMNSKIFIQIDRISELKSLHYFYLPLLLNEMQYTIIPIQIDNNDLAKIYCGDEANSKNLTHCKKNLKPEYEIPSSKKKPFIIDFGQVPQGAIRQKFIFLINSNEFPIKINDIIIHNSNMNFLLDIEGYEYFGNDRQYQSISLPSKGYLIKKLKERNKNNNESISFLINANTAVKLSINLFTDDINIEKIILNVITIYYGDDNKFILGLNASILKGNLALSENSYMYEPAFSGLYQKKIIEARNNYNIPINILSIESNDKRINPNILTYKLNPNEKISLMSVHFDPSKFNDYKKDFELNMSNVLTYRELYLWKIENKYFDKLEELGQSIINANISIKTTINTEYVNFNALLIRPNLVKKEKINFGLNQIGKPSTIYIEGINPSDKMLQIKLILADDFYGEINNNEMFDKIEQNLLEKNNDIIIFTCDFVFKINSSLVNKVEYVLIPEKIDPAELRKGNFNKRELIKLLYKYGNEKVKDYINKADNILCKYDKKKQNEILFNKNNEYSYLISQTFSKDFNSEISSVKNMTNKDINEDAKYKYIEKKSFFNSMMTYLFNIYLKYFMNMLIYSNINIVENTQSFFIPSHIQNKIYQIPPHKTFSIGPIIFKPNKSGIIRNTLFLKNNLTLLYPLKLEGEGGGGDIRFIDYYRGINRKKCKIYNEKNLVIEIDESIYDNELKNSGDKFNRTVTLMNVGNLPLIIKNITIDNNQECQTNNLRIYQCKEINISPKEMIDIDIEINPNYRIKALNKIIYFNTEYQNFYLNVIILLTDDFYQKKNFIWIYLKLFVIVFIILNLMAFSLKRIITMIKKQKREICGGENSQEEILNEIDEKEMRIEEEEKKLNNKNSNSNNNKQNKGNKKKKRKKSSQKEDINMINNNSNNKKEDLKDNINEIKNNEKLSNENIINKEKDEIKNEIIKEEKEKEKIDLEDKKEIKIENSKNEENKNERNKNSNIKITKNKKRKIKSSVSSKKSENENNNKIKKENNEESISEEKKEKEKKKSTESNKYNYNENEIFDNYNYYYNRNNYQNRYKKGKKENKKYYYPNYQGNRKYNNYYYENNNNNVYNNNVYNNNSTYNNNYYQHHQKKPVTKITIEEKKVKNLKELFESNEPNKEIKENKNSSKNKKESKTKKSSKNKDININNNIINKNSTNSQVENNFNFDYNFPINKKTSLGKKEEEMNPTFLKDEKINSAFDMEQEILKSLKKDNKGENDDIPKDELNFNFNNDFQFNFNYYFFDRNQSQEEEGEYTGNYEDYKYKSIIDNLNSENPFSTDDIKDNSDNNNYNNIKNEEDDENYEKENNGNNEFINKNKFNFNFMNFDNNS